MLCLPEESTSSDGKSEERERDIHIMLQNVSLFAAAALSDQAVCSSFPEPLAFYLSIPSPQAIVYNPQDWWGFSNKKQAGIFETIIQKEKHI